MICDAEFANELGSAGDDDWLGLVAHEGEGANLAAAGETVRELIAARDERDLVPPREEGRAVILTSGTTGTPKGATRGTPAGLHSLGGVFARVPYRARETMVIAAPLFHTGGSGS